MISAHLFSLVHSQFPGRGLCRWPALLTVIGLVAAAHAVRADVSLPSDTRQRVALDGPWEILQSDSDDLKKLPEEDGQWEPVTVPDQRWRGDGHEQPWPKSLWYRRTFDAPALDGRRAMLHFARAGFQCRVYLNGEEVGNHIGAQTPFQFDVTDTIKAGQSNELVVGCKHSNRAQRGEYDNMPKEWSEPRPEWAGAVQREDYRKVVLEADDGTVAWPNGYGYWYGGIYQPVSLVLTPDAHVNDIFVIPSVRQKRLTVQVELVSHFKTVTDVRLSADVLDGDKIVKTVPAVQLQVQPGRRVTQATLADDWTDPKLWDPDHRNLYRCRVTLEAGEVRDEASDRFGFREIWREGTTVHLNGIPLLLRSETHYAGVNYPWPEGYRPYITKLLRDWRVNAMTIKGQTPADPGYWDFCDEQGMLQIQQIDIGQPMGPPSYWDCGRAFAVELIHSIRNHPSLVVQQLGNENTYGVGGGVPHASVPWTDMLVAIYHAAMAADPTRLRTPGGGDTDQGGVSDFVDIHAGPGSYMNELVPNVHMVAPELMRGNGDKPAMLSEWNEPVTVTMCGVIGDAFYRPIPTYFGLIGPRQAYRLSRQAQAESYYFGATEFRKQRLAAFNGFRIGHVPTQDHHLGKEPAAAELLELATRRMAPIIAVPNDYAHHFRADRPAEMTFFISNDSFSPLDGELVWKLSHGEQPLCDGRVPVQLEPGRFTTHGITIPAQSVAEGPLRCTLDYEVVEGGTTHFRDATSLTFFPSSDWSDIGVVRVYDPGGRIEALIERPGLTLQRVDMPADAQGPPLVVGTQAALSAGDWQHLQRYVAEGGQLLLLRQGDMPEQWCGVDLRFAKERGYYGLPFNPKEGQPHFTGMDTGRASTYAFRRAPQHPVLRGFEDEDLKWWRGHKHFKMPAFTSTISLSAENVVAFENLAKPEQGYFRCLIDAGYQKGMNSALLLEVVHGKGTVLLGSMLMAEKFEDDPAAEALLHACLRYLAQGEARPERRIVGLSPCPSLTARHIAVDSAEASLDAESVAVAAIEARRADWPALHERRDEILNYVQAGGSLYVHDLTPDAAAELAKLLGVPIECQPAPKTEKWWLDASKLASPRSGHPLTDGIGNFDLNWTVFGHLTYGQIALPDQLLEFTVHSTAPGAEELTEAPLDKTCALLRVPLGKGQLVIDQVQWDTTPSDYEYLSRGDVGHGPVVGRADVVITNSQNHRKANRYIATLLTNLLHPVTP